MTVDQARVSVALEVEHNFGDLIEDLARIRKESNFSQVVLTGINAIRKAQQQVAPTGKDRSIPGSIRANHVVSRDNYWYSDSITNEPRAIFTNEGTGMYGPSKSPYPIVQNRTYQSGPRRGESFIVNIMHPGIRGTHWWEKGADLGGIIALAAFDAKVERILRLKGRS